MENVDEDGRLAAMSSCDDLFTDPFDEEGVPREVNMHRFEDGLSQNKDMLVPSDDAEPKAQQVSLHGEGKGKLYTASSKVRFAYGEKPVQECVKDDASLAYDGGLANRELLVGDSMVEKRGADHREEADQEPFENSTQEQQEGCRRLFPLRRRLPVAKFRFHRVSVPRTVEHVGLQVVFCAPRTKAHLGLETFKQGIVVGLMELDKKCFWK
jgi:hypothetical protein